MIRWNIYSNEPNGSGSYGPWGPFEARDADAAAKRGAAVLSHSEMTLARVEQVVDAWIERTIAGALDESYCNEFGCENTDTRSKT